MELVESGRSFAKMEERKRKRNTELRQEGGGTTSISGGAGEEAGDAHRQIKRRFKQSKPVLDVSSGGKDAGALDQAVLRSVFGSRDTQRPRSELD